MYGGCDGILRYGFLSQLLFIDTSFFLFDNFFWFVQCVDSRYFIFVGGSIYDFNIIPYFAAVVFFFFFDNLIFRVIPLRLPLDSVF